MLPVLAVLALVAVGVWLWRAIPVGDSPAPDPDAVDREEVEAAEREVRDLGPFTSPDEADDHLPDWGPGAPGG